MDIQERLTAFAMLGAGWVLWLLVALSVLGLAVAIERIRFFWLTRCDVDELAKDLENGIDGSAREALIQKLSGQASAEAAVVLAGLNGLAKGVASAEQSMAAAIRLARLRMSRSLTYLGTVGNNAPFVGLLGTVIGIVRAFAELERSQGQVTSGLMAEVGEALVATAVGILVALPAVALFNYFQRLVKMRITQAQALADGLLAAAKSSPESEGD